MKPKVKHFLGLVELDNTSSLLNLPFTAQTREIGFVSDWKMVGRVTPVAVESFEKRSRTVKIFPVRREKGELGRNGLDLPDPSFGENDWVFFAGFCQTHLFNEA